MKKSTKFKGNNAELETLAFFKRRGYSVSLPFGDCDPYDLVVESPTRRLYRVQVRWVSWKGDVAVLPLRSHGRGKPKTLDMTRVEAFAAWDGATIYIVPVRVLGDRINAFQLRRAYPKNNQRKGINLASEFEEACHFLP